MPSAGLIGRGVATEYPSGPGICAQADRLAAIRINAPSVLERICLFPDILCLIG